MPKNNLVFFVFLVFKSKNLLFEKLEAKGHKKIQHLWCWTFVGGQ